MRRRHEQEFGSDSFLDVLANMVGILIILIVIAGVRAARGPVLPPPVEAISESDESAPPSASDEPLEVVVVPPEPDSDEPPPTLQRELSAINSELMSLRGKQAESESEIRRLHAQFTAARKAASTTEKAVALDQQELDDQKARVARLQQRLGDRKEVLTALLAEFEETKNARAPVTQIKHRLAPISQEVEGDEMHFRLSRNRVSVVPLMQLVERVKFQLERQKDWLARHNRNQGTVGPLDGYTLLYTVERLPLSPLDERKLGYGAFRVGVSKWELVVDAELPTETLDESLRRGSRFAAALQAAPEHASLTFWVYPDSFSLFRALQEAAHAEGFVVTGRPLPAGVPIAASPHGSKSAGQ
ncbi:MAG: hypothetical protein EXS05_03085 [Planctomycetaceae bacterium]|nr:hypothetical protein [Planctomycetaceae bacterium]